MLVNEEGKEVKTPGTQSGAFQLGKDFSLESVVVLHLNTEHPFYKKFIYMLQGILKKQKGLIKYCSGL